MNFKPVCPTTTTELTPPRQVTIKLWKVAEGVKERSPSPPYEQLTLTQLLQEKKDKDAAEN